MAGRTRHRVVTGSVAFGEIRRAGRTIVSTRKLGSSRFGEAGSDSYSGVSESAELTSHCDAPARAIICTNLHRAGGQMDEKQNADLTKSLDRIVNVLRSILRGHL